MRVREYPHQAQPAGWFLLVVLFCGMAVARAQVPLGELPGSDWLMAPEAVSSQMMAAYENNRRLAEAVQFIERGELDSALANARQVLAAEPDSAPANEVLGIVLVLQGKVDDGMMHLQRAVQLNPAQSTAITKIGDVYLAKGEVAKAKAQFLQAIAVNPADRWAHQRLGMIIEDEGDYPQAVEHYERGLVGTPPDYLGIKVNLGRLYNLSRQFQKTVQLLEPVTTENCPVPSAHLILGMARLRLGETNSAVRCFETARKLSRVEQMHLALGIAYRDAGDNEKSCQEIQKALEAKPRWPQAMYQMGETLVAMDRIPAAVEEYRKAASTLTNGVPVYNRMAEVYSSRKQYDEALKIYESLERGGTADLRTYDGMATLLQRNNRPAEAERVLQGACKKYPASSQPQYRLGLHYAYLQQYDRAMPSLETARKMAPSDPRLLKAISLVAYRRGDMEQALAEAKRLLEIVPASVEDQFYLATLFDESRKYDEAAAWYNKVLEREPSHIGALNNLAQIRARQKQLTAAAQLAEKAVKLDPNNAAVLDSYGWILCEKGEWTAARPALEKAVDRVSHRSLYRYHLAVAYRQLGMNAKALEELELALKTEEQFANRADAERLASEWRSRPSR